MTALTFVPVGTILPYAGLLAQDDAPAAALAQIKTNLFIAGWLLCDGTPQSRFDYPALFGTIGYAFGGAGDSFNVPDLRGQFIRGASDTAAQDPDRGGRKHPGGPGFTGTMVGSTQADAFQMHQHRYTEPVMAPAPTIQGGEVLEPCVPTPGQPTTGYVADPANPAPPLQAAPRTSTETRPVNIYLNYIVRYRAEIPFGAPHGMPG
jgi:hypothetical protein